jgi:hypothetical protein
MPQLVGVPAPPGRPFFCSAGIPPAVLISARHTLTLCRQHARATKPSELLRILANRLRHQGAEAIYAAYPRVARLFLPRGSVAVFAREFLAPATPLNSVALGVVCSSAEMERHMLQQSCRFPACRTGEKGCEKKLSRFVISSETRNLSFSSRA